MADKDTLREGRERVSDIKYTFAQLANHASELGLPSDDLAVAYFRQKWAITKDMFESMTGQPANYADRMLSLTDEQILSMIKAIKEDEADLERQERAKVEARTTDEWLEIVRDLEERIESLEWELQDDEWKREY
jgi:hypothetical protein